MKRAKGPKVKKALLLAQLGPGSWRAYFAELTEKEGGGKAEERVLVEEHGDNAKAALDKVRVALREAGIKAPRKPLLREGMTCAPAEEKAPRRGSGRAAAPRAKREAKAPPRAAQKAPRGAAPPAVSSRQSAFEAAQAVGPFDGKTLDQIIAAGKAAGVIDSGEERMLREKVSKSKDGAPRERLIRAIRADLALNGVRFK